MQIQKFIEPCVQNCSDEQPTEGVHKGIIKEVTPVPGGDTYFVTIELEEKDSNGKPKFIWQELSYEDMVEIYKELIGDKND